MCHVKWANAGKMAPVGLFSARLHRCSILKSATSAKCSNMRSVHMYVATAAKISSYPQFTSHWDYRVRSGSQRRSQPSPCPEYTGFHTPEYCLSHHHWRPVPTIILVESLALKDTVSTMDLKSGSISLGCMWPKSRILGYLHTYHMCICACVCQHRSQSILKEISPEHALEGPMLKLKLQYFGYLMWRADSLEKTLMLAKGEEGGRDG